MTNTVTTSALRELKDALRMNDYRGDSWGTTMSAWFTCAAYLYEKGNTPLEWNYKRGEVKRSPAVSAL